MVLLVPSCYIILDIIFHFCGYNYRSAALSEAQWKQILMDMLGIRDKAYNTVSPDVCYQVQEIQKVELTSRYHQIY